MLSAISSTGSGRTERQDRVEIDVMHEPAPEFDAPKKWIDSGGAEAVPINETILIPKSGHKRIDNFL